MSEFNRDGESLWRGDEPSPTRSSVMVRFSRSHIRFGTFERLHYLQRPDLIEKLLHHVIDVYYPHLTGEGESFSLFYAELVKRVAQLTAQWMAAGFCHGVLNTDNMSITGESFDYGPYAFIPTFSPNFTAAYFDYAGRYSYGNQPFICRLNLELLQVPLSLVMSKSDLEEGLSNFDNYYYQAYSELMLNKLGIIEGEINQLNNLVQKTVNILLQTQIGYHEFFALLREEFNMAWFESSSTILENIQLPVSVNWQEWRVIYHQVLQQGPKEARKKVGERLAYYNPKTALLRPLIESVWEAITTEDDWQPFNDLVECLQKGE